MSAPDTPPWHRLAYRIAIALTLFLAIVLRLGWAGVGSFASDEARLSWLALRMGRGGELITGGITSSAGAPNLPASVYIFLPPYVLSPDPLLATVFVGVLNVLAVVGVWWLVRCIAPTWGIPPREADWVAWGAMLYVSAQPFAVFFSRNIWTQNLLFPFAIALMLCLWWAHSRAGARRSWAIIGASVCAGIAFQVHLAGISLLLVWLWAALVGRWWRNGRDRFAVLIGAGLAALMLMPFLVAALTTSPDYLGAYQEALGQGERRIDAQTLGYGLRLAMGYDWNYLGLGDTGAVGEDALILAGMAALLLLLGVRAMLTQAGRQGARWALSLVFVVLLAPILTFTPYTTAPRLHYLLGMLAGLPFLVAWAWASRHQALRALAISLTLIISGVWAGQGIYTLAQIDGRTAVNGMGMTLQSVRDTTLLALGDVPTTRPVVVHTQSDDISARGEPATWATLAWERLIAGHLRITSGWHMLLMPADAPFTLMTDAEGMPAWEEAHYWARRADVPEQAFNPIEAMSPIFRLDFESVPRLPDAYRLLDAPVSLASGLDLVAVQTRFISGRYRVTFVYEVRQLPPSDAGIIQQFTHLRPPDNAEGAPAYVSDIPLSAHHWRVGDRLISIADFFLPEDAMPDATWFLDVGHYRLQDGVRFARLDDAGDTVRLMP